eukprot:CAMPEP_0117672324 /NCGR_PEP_ID=MMETSP0804-20121206/13839_1 /TAXON_ID=1074897 /ORGANISM="Tetraselmis astigmatica, Strain CCMP880" /LENGTH=56 /DNA_ID=CAMNT_0005480909 /DNA_START=602 /DNA_END=772 /DNA_ORIENTATION=-
MANNPVRVGGNQALRQQHRPPPRLGGFHCQRRNVWQEADQGDSDGQGRVEPLPKDD